MLFHSTIQVIHVSAVYGLSGIRYAVRLQSGAFVHLPEPKSQYLCLDISE